MCDRARCDKGVIRARSRLAPRGAQRCGDAAKCPGAITIEWNDVKVCLCLLQVLLTSERRRRLLETPLGVEVRWDATPVAEPPTTVLHVTIVDEPNGEGVSRERLGWIRFMALNEPDTIVTLSRGAALRLLDSTPTLRQWPAPYRDLLLSRIMGRALAHELGHYILASSAHASSGLMRANLPVDALIAKRTRSAYGVGVESDDWIEVHF